MTAAEHLAEFLDVTAQIESFEQQFRSGEMTTSEFTDATAHFLAGQRVGAITDHLEGIPVLPGVPELVDWLKTKTFG